ncbi:hypothetical protein MC885_018055, partial [Smutsia gigantea]
VAQEELFAAEQHVNLEPLPQPLVVQVAQARFAGRLLPVALQLVQDDFAETESALGRHSYLQSAAGQPLGHLAAQRRHRQPRHWQRQQRRDLLREALLRLWARLLAREERQRTQQLVLDARAGPSVRARRRRAKGGFRGSARPRRYSGFALQGLELFRSSAGHWVQDGLGLGEPWDRLHAGVCGADDLSELRGRGVQSVEVQLENQMVLVETTLPSQDVQALLESTGRQAVLKGMGSGLLGNLGAAVAILEGPGPVQGVVRFLQLTPEHCLIEGTIDGLEPGPHGLHVHHCGDHFNPDGTSHGGPQDSDRHRGDLGNVHADADGRAIFRIEDEQLKVWDVIGRSLVIDEGEDDLGQGNHPLSKITGNSGVRLACGIIARSAGLFQNPKQICSCDGLTIWEERGRPIAGEGRKAQTPSHL